MHRLGDLIAGRLEAMRIEIAGDDEKSKTVLGPPSGLHRQVGTLQILRELARYFFSNRSLKISRNHAIDFMHAVVPAAYCDFVLLDKHWEDQVTRLAKTMCDTGYTFNVARAYSEKNDGIETLLKAICTV